MRTTQNCTLCLLRFVFVYTKFTIAIKSMVVYVRHANVCVCFLYPILTEFQFHQTLPFMLFNLSKTNIKTQCSQTIDSIAMAHIFGMVWVAQLN